MILFNTNSKFSGKALDGMREALEARGVRVLENTLLCQSHPFKKEFQKFDKDAVVDFAHASLRAVGREGKRD